MTKEGEVRVPLLCWNCPSQQRQKTKQTLTSKKACQADITAEYFTETLENAERLEKENASLKEQLKLNSFCKDSFEENNEKVLFYTGLPNWTLLLYFVNK